MFLQSIIIMWLITGVPSAKLILNIGGETLLYISLAEPYVRGTLVPIIKCKFRPYGMDAYTPLDPMKPNQYFPGLTPGFLTSELFLGSWDEKMVGWITCDIYRERGVPPITQTLWITKEQFSFAPMPLPHMTLRKRYSL